MLVGSSPGGDGLKIPRVSRVRSQNSAPKLTLTYTSSITTDRPMAIKGALLITFLMSLSTVYAACDPTVTYETNLTIVCDLFFLQTRFRP